MRAAGVSWSAPAHTMRARSRYGFLVEGDIDRSALRFNLPDLTEEPFPLLALLLVERSRRFNGTQGYLNGHFHHFVTIDRHVTSSINDALKYDPRNSPGRNSRNLIPSSGKSRSLGGGPLGFTMLLSSESSRSLDTAITIWEKIQGQHRTPRPCSRDRTSPLAPSCPRCHWTCISDMS